MKIEHKKVVLDPPPLEFVVTLAAEEVEELSKWFYYELDEYEREGLPANVNALFSLFGGMTAGGKIRKGLR